MTATTYAATAAQTNAEIIPDATIVPPLSQRAPRSPEDFDSGPLPRTITGFALIELLLKRPYAVLRLMRDRQRHFELLLRLLGVALSGFTLYGVAFAIILSAAGVVPRLHPISEFVDDPSVPIIEFQEVTGQRAWLAPISTGQTPAMVFAYTFGLIAATGICLPSLYFYCLLAGVRMSWVDITLHSLKAKATAAMALVGIVPIYVAAVLAVLLFDVPPVLNTALLIIGCALPFIAGLWGTHSLYQGLQTVRDTMPERDRSARACFLNRLVLSWCFVYTAVCPVMIHTVWCQFR